MSVRLSSLISGDYIPGETWTDGTFTIFSNHRRKGEDPGTDGTFSIFPQRKLVNVRLSPALRLRSQETEFDFKWENNNDN